MTGNTTNSNRYLTFLVAYGLLTVIGLALLKIAPQWGCTGMMVVLWLFLLPAAVKAAIKL